MRTTSGLAVSHWEFAERIQPPGCFEIEIEIHSFMPPFAKTSQSQQRKLSSFQGFAKCGLHVLPIGHFAVSISGLRWRRCLAQGSILKWTLDLITHPLSLSTPLSVIQSALCSPVVLLPCLLTMDWRLFPVCTFGRSGTMAPQRVPKVLACLFCFALLCFALFCFVLFSWRTLEPSATASA